MLLHHKLFYYFTNNLQIFLKSAIKINTYISKFQIIQEVEKRLLVLFITIVKTEIVIFKIDHVEKNVFFSNRVFWKK